jgi:nucleoside phosphorylase
MIVFIAADPRECAHLVTQFSAVTTPSLPVHWARRGKWRGREVLAIANGMGADRAAGAVNSVAEVSVAFSIGFCGALDAKLQIGDVVTGTEVHDGTIAWAAKPLSGSSVRVASTDHIVQTAGEKRELRRTGASVVEMEAAGVARAATDLKVPFYCVKVVSDLADEDFANDFNRVRRPDGKLNVGRLALRALVSPRRMGELLRLNSRSTLAAKKMGEFLADCRF